MGAIAIVLMVASGLAWSALDGLRKAMADRMSAATIVAWLFAGQTLLLLAWLLVAGWPQLSAGYWQPAAGAVAINLVTNLLMVRAVALSPLTLTIPYLSLTPVFAAIMGLLLLGELPSHLNIAGLFLVVAGALSLQTPRDGAGVAQTLWRALRQEPGSWRMVVVALLWGVAYPLDKMAVGASAPAFHSMVMAAGVTVGAGVWLVARGKGTKLGAIRRAPWLAVAGMVAGTLGLTLQYMAMPHLPVNIVEAIKRVITLTMAAVVGHFYFSEPLSRSQLAAIALMAVGVVVLLG